MKKFFGVAGGMGPEASLQFCHFLLEETPAKCDQDHLPYVLYNNPQVPDRTSNILGKGPSPLKELLKTAKSLEECGCSFMVIPCNTAHFYIEELRKVIKIPIINMIKETVNEILNQNAKENTFGLLATTGTLKAHLYHKSFQENSLKLLAPSEAKQENSVMKGIYHFKKKGNLREARDTLQIAINELKEKEASHLIAGCTELSCLLEPSLYPEFTIIDPLRVLARKVLRLSRSNSSNGLL